MENLNLHDLEVIKESLSYSRKRIEEYQEHPSYEFKQQQLERINNVANKVSGLIQEQKKA
ncbi:hypothetical protein [Mucilaginibacter boryungensis]|uniref:Uncharacterized protein n=1 Tax=Mucilaginibacter boryungensis TaxID=768480 RepID=A0ABR9XDX1_9SPHI|nr:hypothetical protein [Mucilaginibacter boryungensis]MBE9665385.1 hypothetical protein [Mucilaginibacter boryungensis]